jgi:hypothetical protein
LLCLSQNNFTLLLWDVLPIDGVNILAFLVVPSIPLAPSLLLGNIELNLLADVGFVSVRADKDAFPIDHLQPWVQITAAKALTPVASSQVLANPSSVMVYRRRVFLAMLGKA